MLKIIEDILMGVVKYLNLILAVFLGLKLKIFRRMTALAIVIFSVYLLCRTGALVLVLTCKEGPKIKLFFKLIFKGFVFATKTVLCCWVGYAVGSLASHCHGLRTSHADVDRELVEQRPRSFITHPKVFFSYTDHRRFSGIVNYFRYPILYVAIPGDFFGSIGCLFSMQLASGERGANPGFAFFSLDPKRYVREDLPFRTKFWDILKENGHNPALFPEMLTVTTPSFLGYAFNPVSYFYFYTPSGKLGPIVYEVKNTFGERHCYVLSREHAAAQGGIKPRKGFTFADRHEKQFHISPFNHRSGYYEFHMTDPVADGVINILMVVFDTEGKKTMTASVKSEGKPVNLLSVSTKTCAWLVLCWGLTQLMAIPRTFWEAYKIFRRGLVRVYERPQPLPSTGVRSETLLERYARAKWIKFLEAMVAESRQAVKVTVQMPRTDPTVPGETVTFTSPVYFSKHASCADENCLGCAPKHVVIDVRSPAFFSRLMTYNAEQVGYKADIASKLPGRRTALITERDWINMLSLLENPEKLRHTPASPSIFDMTLDKVIALLLWYVGVGLPLGIMYSFLHLVETVVSEATGYNTQGLLGIFKCSGIDAYYLWDYDYVFLVVVLNLLELVRQIFNFVAKELSGMGFHYFAVFT